MGVNQLTSDTSQKCPSNLLLRHYQESWWFRRKPPIYSNFLAFRLEPGVGGLISHTSQKFLSYSLLREVFQSYWCLVLMSRTVVSSIPKCWVTWRMEEWIFRIFVISLIVGKSAWVWEIGQMQCRAGTWTFCDSNDSLKKQKHGICIDQAPEAKSIT